MGTVSLGSELSVSWFSLLCMKKIMKRKFYLHEAVEVIVVLFYCGKVVMAIVFSGLGAAGYGTRK